MLQAGSLHASYSASLSTFRSHVASGALVNGQSGAWQGRRIVASTSRGGVLGLGRAKSCEDLSMMLLDDYKQTQRLIRQCSQPNLCFVRSCDPQRVLAEIQRDIFTDLEETISFYFVSINHLGCVIDRDESTAIYVHQILNHSDTPVEVIRLLCIHELLHLRIRPREIDGKRTIHPPEFWEEEATLCPERDDAWSWIWGNYPLALKPRPRLERIDVKSNWKDSWGRKKLSIEELRSLGGFQ